MENRMLETLKKPILWDWVIVGYCLFVIFHLFPSFFLLGIVRFGMPIKLSETVWFVLGLAVISMFIGYRSRGVTIIEPAISSLFYCLTLVFEFVKLPFSHIGLRAGGNIYLWFSGVLAVSVFFALLGEILQRRKEKKLVDWKWVGISIASYLLFYALPILIARRPYTHYHMGEFERVLVAVWIFGGVIIVAAVIGYLSKGVTLIEPVIASIGTILLWVIAYNLFVAPGALRMSRDIPQLFAIIGATFLLSLGGAWLGERAQKLWRKEPPPSA